MELIATQVVRFVAGTRIVRCVLYKSVLLWTPVFWIALVPEPQTVSNATVWGVWLNIALYLMWAYAINDYADRDCDAAVGKVRSIARLSDRTVFVILALLLIVNFAVGYSVAGWGYYLLFLTLGLWGGLAYSLKPFRFKERGVWGLCFPGLLGKVIPFAMVCVLYETVDWCLVVLCFGEFIKNTIDILFHQIVDEENDRKCSVKTFVVERGIVSAKYYLRHLTRFGLLLAVVIVFLYGIYIPEFRWVLAGLIVLYVPVKWYAEKLFNDRGERSLPELLTVPYLFWGYTVFILSPLWLSSIAAIRHPEFWGIVLFLSVLMGGQTVFYLRYRYR